MRVAPLRVVASALLLASFGCHSRPAAELRGPEAVQRFGHAARNGVIFVWTKRLPHTTPSAGARDTNPPPFQQIPRAPDTTALARRVPGVAGVPTGPRVSCDSGCRHAPPPLFVIDGVVVGRHTPPTLERGFIDTVIVLRGAKATARYGDAGRDGVVEIRMLRRDTLPFAKTSPATPLPLRQAAALCGYMAGRAPATVIDGFMLPGVSATEAKWPQLRWSEVLRRDRYSPDEAMAEFGMRGRWGATLYTTIYADSADSLRRRRPPASGVVIRGVATLAPSDTQPLYVVNGTAVPASDSTLQSLDPNDIEAIDVYKCPDAVATYGRRARGGAIVISLKAGAVYPRPATKP